MQVAKWKGLLLMRDSFARPSSHSSSFHSTPISLAKWKSKWNSDAGRSQQPTKNYVRYAVRQKREDAKQALRDLLLNSTCSKLSFQDDDLHWTPDKAIGRKAEQEAKSPREKKSARRAKSRHSRNKRGQRNDDDEEADTTFQATFGRRCFTWSFRSWEDTHFQNSTFGFEWRDQPNCSNDRRRVWVTTETDDGYDEPSVIGSYADRTTLGLPPTGPLKMEDVKNAFRASALKWHPDKHQGSSQAIAEEKFKLCVDAYKSLCDALSS